MIEELVLKAKRLCSDLSHTGLHENTLKLAKEIRDGLDQMTGPVKEVKGMKSVILYFANQKDLDDFVNAIRTVKPNMVTRKL